MTRTRSIMFFNKNNVLSKVPLLLGYSLVLIFTSVHPPVNRDIKKWMTFRLAFSRPNCHSGPPHHLRTIPDNCCQIVPRFAPFSTWSAGKCHTAAVAVSAVRMGAFVLPTPQGLTLFPLFSSFIFFCYAYSRSFFCSQLSTGQRKLSFLPDIVTDASNNVETFLSNHFRQWCPKVVGKVSVERWCSCWACCLSSGRTRTRTKTRARILLFFNLHTPGPGRGKLKTPHRLDENFIGIDECN